MTAGTLALLANPNKAEIFAIRGPPAKEEARPGGLKGQIVKGSQMACAEEDKSARGGSGWRPRV